MSGLSVDWDKDGLRHPSIHFNPPTPTPHGGRSSLSLKWLQHQQLHPRRLQLIATLQADGTKTTTAVEQR